MLSGGPVPRAPRQTATFSSAVDLVEVYVTVTGKDGEPLTGLTAEDFAVMEDGAPQDVAVFTAGEFPLSTAIAIDRSFSMAGEPLERSKRAARAFVGALRPADEVTVLAIGSEVETVMAALPASDVAAASWDSIDPWGTTPLYDGGVQALAAMDGRRGRRALLLLSDGADRESRTSAGELIDRARRSGVLVYPVAVGGRRPSVFAELAAVTGGRSFLIEDRRQIELQMAALARELRHQYLIGYVPARPATRAPEWRSIHVTVSRPDARVRAREGYVAR